MISGDKSADGAVSPGPVETPILREFRAVLGNERVDSDISRVGRCAPSAFCMNATTFSAPSTTRYGVMVWNPSGDRRHVTRHRARDRISLL